MIGLVAPAALMLRESVIRHLGGDMRSTCGRRVIARAHVVLGMPNVVQKASVLGSERKILVLWLVGKTLRRDPVRRRWHWLDRPRLGNCSTIRDCDWCHTKSEFHILRLVYLLPTLQFLRPASEGGVIVVGGGDLLRTAELVGQPLEVTRIH